MYKLSVIKALTRDVKYSIGNIVNNTVNTMCGFR